MIYVAIPVMNEPQAVAFVKNLCRQIVLPKGVFVCVNQPSAFWKDSSKRHIAETNIKVLAELQELCSSLPFTLEILDYCSVGMDERHVGVGWARKLALDAINDIASPKDVMVWMDADTVYPDNYLEEVAKVFSENSNVAGLTNPYYHSLDGFDNAQQITALRYEIYMRAYLINLYRSNNPYCFTAIGSGVASTVKAYRKIGGITPVKSGEDFYFIQKLCKTGFVSAYSDVLCYPSIRASDRVFFGTGPSIIKGLLGDWKSYPIYPFELFREVEDIYKSFDRMWDRTDDGVAVLDVSTIEKFKSNSKTKEQFIKFCTEKFDALRTLQYLKSRHIQDDITDEENLGELLEWCGYNGDISDLKNVRQTLFEKEMLLRRTYICSLTNFREEI